MEKRTLQEDLDKVNRSYEEYKKRMLKVLRSLNVSSSHGSFN